MDIGTCATVSMTRAQFEDAVQQAFRKELGGLEEFDLCIVLIAHMLYLIFQDTFSQYAWFDILCVGVLVSAYIQYALIKLRVIRRWFAGKRV